MNSWRVAGMILLAGLALFLLTLLLKVLLVVLAAGLLIRVVGGRLMGRRFGSLGRGGWRSADIISIDNPAYRSPMNRVAYERVVPIN